METGPLVSVCMPAYNAGEYIAQAIESVINQSYANWELIIVDDGSTDNTSEVANGFSDKRIIVLHQQNSGQCAAANRAFAVSNGDLIKFFDADDLLSSEFIQNQVSRLGDIRDCVVSAKWGRFYNDDLSTFQLNPENVWQDMTPGIWLITAWTKGNQMMQCALWLIPREILNRSGLWDERLSLINDFDFFTRVLLESRLILFESDAVLYYRSGLKGSLSGNKSRKGYKSAFLSIKKATSALLDRQHDPATLMACANIWQLFIYDIYPESPDLIQKAENYLKLLPKPSIRFPCGGYTKWLVQLLNWKTAKYLKWKLTKFKAHQLASMYNDRTVNIK